MLFIDLGVTQLAYIAEIYAYIHAHKKIYLNVLKTKTNILLMKIIKVLRLLMLLCTWVRELNKTKATKCVSLSRPSDLIADYYDR